ncbi:hypothetical protein BDQ17DRAFT_1544280 [Cyathus striatus]|nr:hypothetical protein BDQ17DRAFT_1544280 [Cyathus striatus]
MGVWINGASEVDALWMLSTEIVPMYIIHEYRHGIDLDRALASDFQVDFIKSTPAQELNSEDNPYLKKFEKFGEGTILVDEPLRKPEVEPDIAAEDSARSSSWAHSHFARYSSGSIATQVDGSPITAFSYPKVPVQ